MNPSPSSIRDLRLAARLTQARLAAALGIYQASISQWETGVAMPRADRLPALARVLGCTVDELLASWRAPRRRR